MQNMQLLGKLDFSQPSFSSSFQFDSLETYYQVLKLFYSYYVAQWTKASCFTE